MGLYFYNFQVFSSPEKYASCKIAQTTYIFLTGLIPIKFLFKVHEFKIDYYITK